MSDPLPVAAEGAPRVGVVMPTFKQAAYVPRALASLLAQTFTDWELVVVDDGSPDRTRDAVAPFLRDPRLRYVRLEENRGLGHALNCGLDLVRADLVAYLPSDDVYHADHLASLVARLGAAPEAVLAFSGVRHAENRVAPGQIDGEPLQLAQVLHRRTPDRWLERDELTTDDLDRMLWAKLRARGAFVPTGRATCEWVDHPDQRHKRIREGDAGGINTYRSFYGPCHPLRYHSSIGSPIDEVERYRRFRERPPTPPAPDGLKILLVGELAFNPERVLALEERGHRLYGLWTSTPADFNTVGPLPFGHVEDLPRAGWRDAVRRLKPDVIYAQLNWQTVPFAHHVLTENPGVPFVWHFKEGPFFCIKKGTWPLLAELHTRSDGRIYASPELRDWFAAALPEPVERPTLALDGDLPKREWFEGAFSPRLGETDGEVHTVLPGRPMGLEPEAVAGLAAEGIHLHFYGEVFHRRFAAWVEEVQRLAPGYLHLHPQCDQNAWVSEFSKYDAGWLHTFASENDGDLRRATWDDLNYPARLATLAAAGLPPIQRDNAGAVVATQSLARDLDIGVCYRDVDD
ncbi:MAG: glycosyltransferase family 2 protein, partial [Chloroflexota bacterium]|nr:glycosyltransferase family 2 protein [Chloroflexota bacterium]